MKSKKLWGGVLSVAGALLNIVGVFVIFLTWYEKGMQAEAAEPGCEILLKSLMPALGDVGLLAGVLFGVAAYLFFTGNRWAFRIAVIAEVLALQATFFINVPFMAADLPPVYFALFFPNLVLYFLFTRWIGELPWTRVLTGLLAGMTYVFCLMNGIASLSRIITIGKPLFFLVQRSHWIAMVGWGIVTVQTILRPKEWARIVGIGAGLMELAVGIPLALATAVQLERFSLFALGPIFSAVLLVVLLMPKVWNRLVQPDAETIMTRGA